MMSRQRGIPKSRFVGGGPIHISASDIWPLLFQVVHMARPVYGDWCSLRDSTVSSFGSPYSQWVIAGRDPNVSPSMSPAHRSRLQPVQDTWVGPVSESLHIPCWLESCLFRASGARWPNFTSLPSIFSSILSILSPTSQSLIQSM